MAAAAVAPVSERVAQAEKEEEEDEDDGDDRWVGGLLRYELEESGCCVTVLSDPRGTIVHGTGSGLWACGRVLAQYISQRPELCRGARCLELGAGTGAVGLTVAALGAETVVLTDVDAQIPLLWRNAEANGHVVDGAVSSSSKPPASDADAGSSKPDVRVVGVDWRSLEQRARLDEWAQRWTLVIGSDVGYDPELFDPLLETLEAQCSPETDIYLCLADRDEEGEPSVEDFVRAARKSFECRQLLERRLEPMQSMSKLLQLRKRSGRRRRQEDGDSSAPTMTPPPCKAPCKAPSKAPSKAMGVGRGCAGSGAVG